MKKYAGHIAMALWWSGVVVLLFGPQSIHVSLGLAAALTISGVVIGTVAGMPRDE